MWGAASRDPGEWRAQLGTRYSALGTSPLRPIKGLLFPHVNVADAEEQDEDEHLAEEQHAGVAADAVAVDDGPRVEERRLDVEQDEEHGDLVEADVDPLAVQVEQRHAALVRRELGGIPLVLADEPGQ